MVTCGIWRPVYLEFTNKAVVEDYFVHQKSVTSERAEIDNRLEVNNITGTVQEAQIKVTCAYRIV